MSLVHCSERFLDVSQYLITCVSFSMIGVGTKFSRQ